MSAGKQKQAADTPAEIPLPNPPTGSAHPSSSISALWAYLQPALDHIVRSPTSNPNKAPVIDVSYHMGIHTAIYDYVTMQSEANSASARVQPLFAAPLRPGERFGSASTGKASGSDLYERIDAYYADIAREIFLGAPNDDSALIEYLVASYDRYSLGAQSVSRLLNYVNRHCVRRATDEDRGWLRLSDILDTVANNLDHNEGHDQIQRMFNERQVEELKKWGYQEGGDAAAMAMAEGFAEAASPLDRLVPLTSLAYRRLRVEVIEPLLAVPKAKGKKKPPAGGSDKPAMPRGRLARAVKELLESESVDEEERQRLGGGLAVILRNVGIKMEHPLRKKLDKYIPPPQPSS